MTTEVLVLRADGDDPFVDAIAEALAARGLRFALVDSDEAVGDERVTIVVGDVPRSRILGRLAAGSAVLPTGTTDGWLASGGLRQRARQIADAAEALLSIGRPDRLSDEETIARAFREIDTRLSGPSDSSSLTRICQALAQAIEWGAPIYNGGNPEGCARIYRYAADTTRRYIDALVELGEGRLLDAIADELDRVEAHVLTLPEDDWDEQAWALRQCFDRILIARHTADALYAIDDLFSELLRAGRSLSASLIHDVLTVAISHGAPIYNAGSPVGCAQIYLCTAAGLLKLLGAEPRPGEGHCEPQARTALTPIVGGGARRIEEDPDGLVWDLRNAFDSLVELAAGERTWEHDS